MALKRSYIRARRSKPRPGRLKGADLKELRAECFIRDQYRCRHCGVRVDWETGHMAHIKAKRIGGDWLGNVMTLCGPLLNDCHGKSHNAGGKPCPAKPKPELVRNGETQQ